MALTELTKVTGPGIHTLSNVLSHNIKSSGIITATKFSGPLDSIGGNFAGVITATNGVFSGNISAVDGNFSGNVTIGGTLTYEDVTNIDSVGIITARDGIDCNGDIDVDGHTNLDNVSIAGITTYSKSGSALRLNDGSILRLGNADADFFLYHDGNNIDYISAGASKQLRLTTDDFVIKGANNTETLMTAAKDGPVHLYHNNISRLSTSSVGVSISQDLDVDGHTNLDNVSIVGVTTLSNTGANQLVIKDSDTSGDAAHMRISFQDSGGTEKFFVGNNNSNGWLYLGSPSGQNNNIAFRVNGGDKFQVNAAGAYVNGDLTVNGTVDILDSIIHTGDTNTKIRFPAADVIAFETGGTERLRINSDGRIWVNTQTGSSATELLRVENTGSSSTDSRVSIISGSTGQAVLLFGDDQSFNQGQIVYSNSDHSMRFHANAGNERLRIDSSGRLLIGTVTATGAAKLQLLQSSGDGLLVRNHDTNYEGIILSNASGEARLMATSGGSTARPALTFYASDAERLRIDSNGVSGTVKNNFLQTEFQRHDTSSQYGPLSTSFSTDNNISATISNYQRGQRIIVRATVPCGIALQNGSGANYAGTSARIKVTNGSASTYSNDRASWYRADGNGTHETTQNLFICLYINESNTDFSNGNTLTVTIEGKKNSGTGTSTHYIGGWSSVKEITVERYEKSL